MKLTQDRLKELLHYDKKTGAFTRRNEDLGVAGDSYNKKTYSRIRIDRISYRADELVFLYVFDRVVKNPFHKNYDKRDNRFVNLIDMTTTKYEPKTMGIYEHTLYFVKRWGVKNIWNLTKQPIVIDSNLKYQPHYIIVRSYFNESEAKNAAFLANWKEKQRFDTWRENKTLPDSLNPLLENSYWGIV